MGLQRESGMTERLNNSCVMSHMVTRQIHLSCWNCFFSGRFLKGLELLPEMEVLRIPPPQSISFFRNRKSNYHIPCKRSMPIPPPYTFAECNLELRELLSENQTSVRFPIFHNLLTGADSSYSFSYSCFSLESWQSLAGGDSKSFQLVLTLGCKQSQCRCSRKAERQRLSHPVPATFWRRTSKS